ncbi:hypothetical protein GGR42_000203 [Saonia flava]|uniref:Lipoprotein n=1 Tax=Saonia flava TaxID=523696 RepID=A0A846QNT0_9FLAO|nr:DUF6146 family protein [Saonia flava]NJB69741.1 hypothetical protein [Saonia flava]
MKTIKSISFLLLLAFLSCKSTNKSVIVSDQEKAIFDQEEGDDLTIGNEETEYEITIIDPGFYTWLQSIARPEGYYSQSFLENRNIIFVQEWNRRVLQPSRFDPNLYELQINYEPNIDYGYEVNYQLYNYFIYFQRKYNQRLGPFIPRI